MMWHIYQSIGMLHASHCVVALTLEMVPASIKDSGRSCTICSASSRHVDNGADICSGPTQALSMARREPDQSTRTEFDGDNVADEGQTCVLPILPDFTQSLVRRSKVLDSDQ